MVVLFTLFCPDCPDCPDCLDFTRSSQPARYVRGASAKATLVPFSSPYVAPRTDSLPHQRETLLENSSEDLKALLLPLCCAATDSASHKPVPRACWNFPTVKHPALSGRSSALDFFVAVSAHRKDQPDELVRVILSRLFQRALQPMRSWCPAGLASRHEAHRHLQSSSSITTLPPPKPTALSKFQALIIISRLASCPCLAPCPAP